MDISTESTAREIQLSVLSFHTQVHSRDVVSLDLTEQAWHVILPTSGEKVPGVAAVVRTCTSRAAKVSPHAVDLLAWLTLKGFSHPWLEGATKNDGSRSGENSFLTSTRCVAGSKHNTTRAVE